MCNKPMSERHYLRNHPIYKVWRGVKTRCLNPNCDRYKDYGGRGIGICDEWKESVVPFYEWCISNGWRKGMHIDRINNDGDYTPSNCRIVSPSKNNEVGRKRESTKNSSGYTGVHFNKKINKWMSQIRSHNITMYLGSYVTVEEAVEARTQKEIELFGEQRTNL